MATANDTKDASIVVDSHTQEQMEKDSSKRSPVVPPKSINISASQRDLSVSTPLMSPDFGRSSIARNVSQPTEAASQSKETTKRTNKSIFDSTSSEDEEILVSQLSAKSTPMDIKKKMPVVPPKYPTIVRESSKEEPIGQSAESILSSLRITQNPTSIGK